MKPNKALRSRDAASCAPNNPRPRGGCGAAAAGCGGATGGAAPAGGAASVGCGGLGFSLGLFFFGRPVSFSSAVVSVLPPPRRCFRRGVLHHVRKHPLNRARGSGPMGASRGRGSRVRGQGLPRANSSLVFEVAGQEYRTCTSSIAATRRWGGVAPDGGRSADRTGSSRRMALCVSAILAITSSIALLPGSLNSGGGWKVTVSVVLSWVEPLDAAGSP